jgi:hemerythrin superfamily protein
VLALAGQSVALSLVYQCSLIQHEPGAYSHGRDMSAKSQVVDLCDEPASRVQSAAFYAVKDLRRGDRVLLITAQDPTLLMQSLDLQLRHKLAWKIVEADGKWRVDVSHRAEADPRDVVDVLALDHRHLDGMFAGALPLLNRGDAAGAAPRIREFAAALKRHMAAEDDVLAPSLAASAGKRDDDPLQVMLREHAEISRQLSVIEECLAAPDAGELGAFCAILSGTLAKHEHREENNLFPQWRAAWARKKASEREELMSQIKRLLASGTGDEGGRRKAEDEKGKAEG